MKQKIVFQSVLLLLLFSFIGASLKAQIIRKDIPDIINSSDAIFEGQVIRSDSYWNQNEDYIYTSHTIEISKIFKGDIICGTIEVITAGGRVGDTDLEISHNLKLLTGEVGLFFCKGVTIFELPSVDYYPESNSVALEVVYSEQGFFKYYNDEINHAVQNPFYNLDSLAQAYDVVELYTQLSYTDCNSTIVSNFEHPNNIFIKRKKRELQSARTAQNRDPNRGVPPRILAQMQAANQKISGTNGTGDTIIFAFQNVYTSGNNQFLEFDVSVRANDNTTYLNNTGVRIGYDNAVFGPNIFNSNNVIVTRGTLIQSAADYDDPLVNDFSNDILSIYTQSVIGVQNRSLLTATFQPLVHVQIEINDCHQEAILYFFDGVAMNGFCSYATSPSAATNSQYNEININSVAQNMLCLPYVTSLTPTALHGGMGEILTINGNNFGAVQGNGKVILQNADDGGDSFSPLDNSDMVSWSNTQIRYIIPSVVDGAMIQGNPYKGTPGSGEVVVMNDLGELSKSTVGINPNAYLNVVYSLMNEKDSINVKRRVDLVNSFGSGGYEFFPNTALQSNASAFSVVKKAANDWRCYSHINYKINNSPLATGSTQNNRNTITLSQTSSPSVMGETARWTTICQPSNQVLEVEIDIRLNNSVNWWYDTTAITTAPTGTIDLYQVMLHEMGHGNLLNHANDSMQVMWWTSFAPVTHRAIDLFADFSTVGAFDVMTHSNTALGCGAVTHIPSLHCWGPNPIEIGNVSAGVRIFPNPTNSTITLLIENPHTDEKATVYNAAGQVLATQTITEIQTEIDLSTYPSGLYFISLTSENQVYSTKIIKQ